MTRRKNKKKGFTLVELLAVIVILAIILVIAVPQIMETINDTTKASFESSAKMVASQVENQYTIAQTLGKSEEEFNRTSGDCMKEWAGLNESDYEACTYEITSDGTAKVTLVGKGKFKDLRVCGGTRSDASAVEESCGSSNMITFKVYDGKRWDENDNYVFVGEPIVYQVPKGMTWGEFINSEYNTEGYYSNQYESIYLNKHHILWGEDSYEDIDPEFEEAGCKHPFVDGLICPIEYYFDSDE